MSVLFFPDITTLLNQCILGVTLNFDLSMLLFFYNVNVWSYISGNNFSQISSLFAMKTYATLFVSIQVLKGT